MRAKHLVLTLSIALSLSASVPALAGDIILKKDGTMMGNRKAENPPTSGDYSASKWTVAEENLEKIKYRIDGIPTMQEVPTEDVAEVFHDPKNSPAEYTRALDAESKGNYAAAIELWGRVASDKAKWAKARGAFGEASCTYFTNDGKTGAAALAKFIREFPDSMWVPQAITMQARALMSAGDVAGARKAFETIKTLKGLSAAEKLAADYWVTWIDEQQAAAKSDTAGLKKALAAYKLLRGKMSASRNPDAKVLAGRCTIGIASCQIGIGDLGSVQAPLEKLIKGSKEPLLLAGAHTKLGHLMLMQNAQAQDEKVKKEALYHFLRVVCLYGPAEGAEDYHAESLYRAGFLFNDLRPAGTDDDSKEKSRRWRAYARREWGECLALFPGSTWAQLSRRDMTSR